MMLSIGCSARLRSTDDAMIAPAEISPASASNAPRPSAADIFEAHEFTLPNGLQVVVVPNHLSPVVVQALAYKAGQIEIFRLRDEARAALGDRFDIKGFHDTVLGSGPTTLPMLGGLVAEWVKATV